jgi:hypothetical protein
MIITTSEKLATLKAKDKPNQQIINANWID